MCDGILLSRRVHVKVKGTLDSAEQNNYGVGEQRERDTKGWSDSEANELRSLEANKWRSVFRGSRELVAQRVQLPQRVHRVARRGSANKLEATLPRFNGMFEINSIAGCGFALELLWYTGERQLPNKISEKGEIICTHKTSTWYSNWSPMIGTVGQQYNDHVARLLPIYRERSSRR